VAHLILRVHVLEKFGLGPPVLFSLNNNSVGFDFLNEFLSTLSQHGRLVHSTNKVNIFTIESLGQMDECGLEAVLTVSESIMFILSSVC